MKLLGSVVAFLLRHIKVKHQLLTTTNDVKFLGCSKLICITSFTLLHFLGYSFWTQGLIIIIRIGVHVHNIRTNISICCVYICMLWNLSVQQINILNSRNGPSDEVIILLRLKPLLTWCLGFHSSREDFESVVITWLLLLKTKNKGCFEDPCWWNIARSGVHTGSHRMW